MTYTQNSTSSVTGINYLAGAILPWEDYVIFRLDDDTSIAIYGKADVNNHFDRATVRTVTRSYSYGSVYTTSEYTASNVDFDIDYPYSAYGNLIGVNYALPSSNNIMCMAVCAAVIVSAVIQLFRIVWGLKKIAT